MSLLSSSGGSLCCPSASARKQQRLASAPVQRRAPLSQQRHVSVVPPVGKSRASVRAAGAGAADAVAEGGTTPWYSRPCGPNSIEVNSVQELVDVLATDQLVIVDVFAPWCGACRALFPKIHKLLLKHPDVLLVKVNFENNRAVCKSLGIKVLPYFIFYHGSLGRVAAFSATVSKIKVFEDALETHSGAICSLEPAPGLAEFPEIVPHPADATLLDRDGWAQPGANVTAGAPSS